MARKPAAVASDTGPATAATGAEEPAPAVGAPVGTVAVATAGSAQFLTGPFGQNRVVPAKTDSEVAL
eukprot:13853838-Alexandrium_andersonii.AAC.1